MVQSYGSTPTAGEDIDNAAHGDIVQGEDSALLGVHATPKKEREGTASMTSSISNLANTIIGSGM